MKWSIILSVIAGVAYIISVVVGAAHGHQFTFDMTDRLNNETVQLEKCIAGTNTTNCSMIYGGKITPEPIDQLKEILGIPKGDYNK